MNTCTLNEVSLLELTMREVMEGLDDLLSGLVWKLPAGVMEDIEINPSEHASIGLYQREKSPAASG